VGKVHASMAATTDHCHHMLPYLDADTPCPPPSCHPQVGQVHASMAATAVSMWAETGSVLHGGAPAATATAASVAGSEEYATSLAGPASMEGGGEGGWDVRVELISEAAAASTKAGGRVLCFAGCCCMHACCVAVMLRAACHEHATCCTCRTAAAQPTTVLMLHTASLPMAKPSAATHCCLLRSPAPAAPCACAAPLPSLWPNC
jgi:hypothetical protein